IKVRNVDVVAVKKIDEMAKGKGMSRNEFLKNHIEKLMWTNIYEDERLRLEELFHASLIALEQMNEQLNNIEQNTNKVKKFLKEI
ncbi:hypothetical protein, partial [Ligilactobacillus salivarius]|uniref:hypothetical protein n=1 Tax=Ligilactobacillus salivarius TaxID=1624 RepID=UPI0023AF1F9C